MGNRLQTLWDDGERALSREQEMAQGAAVIDIRCLMNTNIIGIVLWRNDGEITEANDAFLRMVGYRREDVAFGSMSWRDLTPAELFEDTEQAMLEAVRVGWAQPFEKEYVRKGGGRLPVIVGVATLDASRREGVACVLDLTERKQAEEKVREGERRYREVQTELAHANRVATMGQLAASIAHEVNQPIGATVTNAHAAQRWLAAQPPNLEEVGLVLGNIIRDANRAADVLGRIRGMIRKTPQQKEPVDINEAIREMVEFTHCATCKHGAQVHMQLADALPLVEGDRVELQQVLLNLILNALEAMDNVEEGGRVLWIGTKLDSEGCVQVRVVDSGPGFASGSADQALEPFYSTKPSGLGMGLSICRTIIESHCGRLWVSANEPRGAVVQFTLPTL